MITSDMALYDAFPKVNQIVSDSKIKVIADGYIRECQINSYILIPQDINVICSAYLTPCFSLFYISAPDIYDDDEIDTVQTSSKLIHDSIKIMAISFLSLHIVDINNQHIVDGFNDSNQLGFKNVTLKQTKQFNKLTINDFFNDKNSKITFITNSKSEYSKHMLIQTDANKIYSFGRNQYSQCGYNALEEYQEPMLLQYFISNKINIINIKKGVQHTLFLSDNHILFGCGSNKSYQLGLKEQQIYCEIINISENMDLNIWTKQFKPPIKRIECSGHSTFIIDSNDQLYGMGGNYQGGLGFAFDAKTEDQSITDKMMFTKLNIPNKIKQFDCGENHVCLMDALNNIMTWGLNISGQCGIPKDHKYNKTDEWSSRYVDQPCVINEFFVCDKENVVIDINDKWKIICGFYNTYIFDEKYNVYVCGTNGTGECMIDGKVPRVFVPTFVDNKTILSKYTNGKNIVSIVGDYSGLYIITE
eukprot:88150_1